jgi:hypothetical protein
MRFGIFVEREVSDEESEHGTETVSIEAAPKDEILLEEMRRRYDLQQSEIDTANTKAGLVLAYLGTVFVILITSAPNVFKMMIQIQSIPVIIATSVALLFYVAGVVCCVIAIAPWTFFFPMGAEEQEVEFYMSKNRTDTMLQLLRQYSEYIQKNLPRVRGKSRWFFWSLVFSLAFTLAGACVVCFAHL